MSDDVAQLLFEKCSLGFLESMFLGSPFEELVMLGAMSVKALGFSIPKQEGGTNFTK